jgi:hypothetical protein
MSAKEAEEYFNENLLIIGDKFADPEKYNLYFGLSCLAKAIINIENDIRNIKNNK